MLIAGPRIGMILGLAIGYVESYGLLDRIILGLNSATIYEQKASCTKLAGLESFVKASGEDSGVGFVQPATQPAAP